MEQVDMIGMHIPLKAHERARAIFEELTEIPPKTERASDLLDRSMSIYHDVAHVFVSLPGETANIMHRALCVGITRIGNAIFREIHCGVHINTGPGIGVESTKAYVPQQIVLVMMAIQLAEDRRSMIRRCREIIGGLYCLHDQIRKVLAEDDYLQVMACDTLSNERSLLVMGRALNIKEISYMHTDENMSVILVTTKDPLHPKIQSLKIIRVRQTVDCLRSLISVIPPQLLSYLSGSVVGRCVVLSRKLARSVTVE
ncbi:hypothetical protein BX666DRAFT_2020454 [Dichotomocladium elegans]|nr:hypothetical protein BX666DRAFT_2020454 [Dichotomocladium elegans]